MPRLDLLLDPIFGYATIPRPIYKHDCSNCTWLFSTTVKFAGQVELVDVWVCLHEDPLYSDVLLRYGNDPSEYYSYDFSDVFREASSGRREVVKQAVGVYLLAKQKDMDPTLFYAKYVRFESRKEEYTIREIMTEEDFPGYLDCTNETIDELIKERKRRDAEDSR